MNNALQTPVNEKAAIQNFIVSFNEEMHFEVEGRKLARHPKWKAHFYRAYRKKNYDLAASIYFSKHPYRTDIMSVHQGYSLERRTDRELVVAVVALSLIIVSIITGVAHLL